MGADSKKLSELEVLVLDCQATGASPRRGHLLEMAWCRMRAGGGGGRLAAHLVALPAGASVPRRVSRMTGIQKRHLAGAASAASVYQALRGQRGLPLVIHYARYELAFLRDLHERYGGAGRFAPRVVCTHEIARRLFPGLPRRTLRALAGYFGHPTPQLKRAGDHVRATAAIWREMVALLDDECAVDTLDRLDAWLREPPPPRSSRRIYPVERNDRLALPDVPGVYRLVDARGQVLYVGKAASLKSRVNSYFQKHRGHSERTLELLSRVRDVRVTPCGSALEAALAEADAIKTERPPYNVALNQPDGRCWFYSPALARRARRADRRHRVGPVPPGDELEGLRALVSAPAGKAPATRVLGIPRRWCPPADCYRKGIRLFGRRHRVGLRPRDLPVLFRLGGALWGAADAEGEGEEKRQENARDWTPEAVARALEGVVRRAAHLVRRARWLVWLCQASLAWQTGAGSRRLVVIHRGRIVQADDIAPADPPPLPPGAARDATDRRRDFDLATHDRLRVLNTELRRLVASGRTIELRLAPRIRLARNALEKALHWV